MGPSFSFSPSVLQGARRCLNRGTPDALRVRLPTALAGVSPQQGNQSIRNDASKRAARQAGCQLGVRQAVRPQRPFPLPRSLPRHLLAHCFLPSPLPDIRDQPMEAGSAHSPSPPIPLGRFLQMVAGTENGMEILNDISGARLFTPGARLTPEEEPWPEVSLMLKTSACRTC